MKRQKPTKIPNPTYLDIIREWTADKQEETEKNLKYKEYNVIYKNIDTSWQTYKTIAQDKKEAAVNFLEWADSEGIIWDIYHVENHYTAWK